MRFHFGGPLPLRPMQLQRLKRERDAENGLDFRHHINPVRELNDVAFIRSTIEAPRGMTEKKLEAFQSAFNEALNYFHLRFAQEIQKLAEETP